MLHKEGRNNMTEYNALSPRIGDLRVWHIPQIPGNPFFVPVDSIEEGEMIIDVLAEYDLFQYENRIKPDYANMSGLERYEDDDDEPGWYEVDR